MFRTRKSRAPKRRRAKRGTNTKKLCIIITFSAVIFFFVVTNTSNPSGIVISLKSSNQGISNESISEIKSPGEEQRSKDKEQRLDSSLNCIESKLVRDEKPILAKSSLADESIQDFSILLYPRSKDRYISSSILKNGSYEPEMGTFISRALNVDVKNGMEFWAVDIGSNVGFHSLHMARRGANVISFEAAPDTAALFSCSVELNKLNTNYDPQNGSSIETTQAGSITVIQAGASDVKAVGTMSRHPGSPGMTSFTSNSSFPLEALEINGENKEETELEDSAIQLVRVEDILIQKGVPQMDSEMLRLLKVDVEGFELRALKGLNLEKYPFLYLTFEFFPKMLRDAGTDPVELLIYIYDKYDCGLDPTHGSILKENTREEMNEWIKGIKKHVNIYCRLKSVALSS